MKQILLFLKNYWWIACIILLVFICLTFAVTILLKKIKLSNCAKKDVSAFGVNIPQAYTLMTGSTLELEPITVNTSFEVEYEITYIHSDEVIS